MDESDFRKWARIDREIAQHELAIAALFLQSDMKGSAEVHQSAYESHIKSAIVWEKGADEMDAIKAKYDLK